MEILIVICLIVIIILLAKDKVVIGKPVKGKATSQKTRPGLSEIMGKPKPLQRHTVPTVATRSPLDEQPPKADNFGSENREEVLDIVIPREELDEVFGEQTDLEQEEEELSRYGVPNGDEGFATGVTFEELATIGKVLRSRQTEPVIEQKAIEVVQKIQGTELFSLLERSVSDASQKIARLLDKRVGIKTEPGSSKSRNDELSGFNIEEFI